MATGGQQASLAKTSHAHLCRVGQEPFMNFSITMTASLYDHAFMAKQHFVDTALPHGHLLISRDRGDLHSHSTTRYNYIVQANVAFFQGE